MFYLVREGEDYVGIFQEYVGMGIDLEYIPF